MPRTKDQPAPALRSLKSHYLVLVRVLCVKTEDNTGADEVYITVNGRMAWGIVDLNNGQGADLEGVVEPIRFRNSIAVEVWDNDTGIFDSDDRLGRQILSFDPNTLDKELDAEFSDDGARYVLTYLVTDEL